jgi:hypothetical protein
MIQDVCHVVTGQISTEFDKKIYLLCQQFLIIGFGQNLAYTYQLVVSKIKPVNAFWVLRVMKVKLREMLGPIPCLPRS